MHARSAVRLVIVLGLLALAAPVAAQSIPLMIEREGGSRALVSLRLRRGERVICEHDVGPELDAPPCGEQVELPGPGSYVAEIDVIPIGEEPRSYRYRLPVARDATAATLVLAVGTTWSPDTAWLGGIWLDVERPGAPEGVWIDDAGRLHTRRAILWRYGHVQLGDRDGRPLAVSASWCGLGPHYGELYEVRPGEPAYLAGSASYWSTRSETDRIGTVRIRAPVHLVRTAGSTSDRIGRRPLLRRTDRRWVEHRTALGPTWLHR